MNCIIKLDGVREVSGFCDQDCILENDSAPGASQVALVVKNPAANAGCIRDTGLILELKDPPEEGKVMHYSILA